MRRPVAAGAVVLAGAAATTGAAVLLAYPRPALLARTLRNARRPDIDPDAVRDLATMLPDDPDLIREQVEGRLMPFAYDWDVYGVPYYFPTLAEALQHGRGDCKSQVLVLASVLAAKGIGYRLLASLDHVWADYPGKGPAPMEDPAVAVAELRDGRWRARRPSRVATRSHLRVSAECYWHAAPRARRRILAIGAFGLGALGFSAFLLVPTAIRPRRRP